MTTKPTTGIHPKSTVATRTLKARRVVFDHADLGNRRHYFDDDLIGSHLVATLSGVIPPGERFVAETVRRYRREVGDPALSTQANAFVGQEMIHQREHDRFNKALARLGYPTAVIDRASAVAFAVMSQFPHRLQVAMTAAVEHVTTAIVEPVLADGWLNELDLPAQTRALLGWHLTEELEHKAVAFDTMQAIGVSENERILGMRLLIGLLAPVVIGGLALSLAIDPATYNPRNVLRSLRRLPTAPIWRPSFLRNLLSYERHGFHPDERNIEAQLDQWRHEYIESNSHVAERLASSS